MKCWLVKIVFFYFYVYSTNCSATTHDWADQSTAECASVSLGGCVGVCEKDDIYCLALSRMLIFLIFAITVVGY